MFFKEYLCINFINIVLIRKICFILKYFGRRKISVELLEIKLEGIEKIKIKKLKVKFGWKSFRFKDVLM